VLKRFKKCLVLCIWTINFPRSNLIVCRKVVKYRRIYKLIESDIIVSVFASVKCLTLTENSFTFNPEICCFSTDIRVNVLDIFTRVVFVVRMTCGSSEVDESFIVTNTVTVSADTKLMDVCRILSECAFTNVRVYSDCVNFLSFFRALLY